MPPSPKSPPRSQPLTQLHDAFLTHHTLSGQCPGPAPTLPPTEATAFSGWVPTLLWLTPAALLAPHSTPHSHHPQVPPRPLCCLCLEFSTPPSVSTWLVSSFKTEGASHLLHQEALPHSTYPSQAKLQVHPEVPEAYLPLLHSSP